MSRLQASLDLDASMYQTYYNLGVAAINANKYDVAIDALENGIKINSDFSDFYYSLGVAQIGKADDIVEYADTEEIAEANINTNKVNIQREIAPEQKATVIKLKKSAIENFEKYLHKNPNTQNKEDIEEMIKQSEEDIATLEEGKKN